jgi:hypothetical protein
MNYQSHRKMAYMGSTFGSCLRPAAGLNTGKTEGIGDGTTLDWGGAALDWGGAALDWGTALD